MGLVTNIERWDMAAAIAMATEGIRAKYNVGAGGGGFGADDIEIGSKLDGSRILAAVDKIEKKAPHLSDWCMFAYASPLWNSKDNKTRLVDTVLNDWVLNKSMSDITVQQKTIERIKSLIPVVASSVALEQASGAETKVVNGELHYQPSFTRSYIISVLVSTDCDLNDDQSDSFKNKRRRYYQTNWNPWAQYIEELKNILTTYDGAARKMFKNKLDL